MINKNRINLLRKDLTTDVKIGTSVASFDTTDRLHLNWQNMYVKWEAIDKVVLKWFPSASIAKKTFGGNGGALEYKINE